MKLALKETFSSIQYGDEYRTPTDYIQTHTKKKPFIGTIPKEIEMQSTKTYQEFPLLSQRLLVQLFSDIGVDYVPEICIYQLKKRRPIEVFVDFVISFGITIEHRLDEIEIIDANVLNRVISSLQTMDEIRRDSMVDSKPIYKLLVHQEFDKVDKIIDNLKIG
jgi:hypothetical protein